MPRPGWVKQGLPAPTHMLQQGFSPLLRTAGLSIRPQAIRVVLCPPWLDRRPPPPRAPPMCPPPSAHSPPDEAGHGVSSLELAQPRGADPIV